MNRNFMIFKVLGLLGALALLLDAPIAEAGRKVKATIIQSPTSESAEPNLVSAEVNRRPMSVPGSEERIKSGKHSCTTKINSNKETEL